MAEMIMLRIIIQIIGSGGGGKGTPIAMTPPNQVQINIRGSLPFINIVYWPFA